jgi:hypothetical protein
VDLLLEIELSMHELATAAAAAAGSDKLIRIVCSILVV